MAPDNCPDLARLRDFTLGKLLVDEAETIARHLDTCSTCDSAASALEEESDALVSELRRPDENEFVSEPEYQQAAALIEAFGRPSSAAFEPTQYGPGLGELGNYRLLAKLGEGGMGAVYKALHLRLDRIVAVKVLRQDRLKNAAALARFNREMKAVGKLDHPNIVRASDAGEADGTHFLVMEYVPGCDLAEVLRRAGRLRVADACELVRQAAVGLSHAHQHGMIHRDIKPSNLMLAVQGSGVGSQGSGIVKVLDLGLALLQGHHDATPRELTAEGQMMGTLDYMAPEQGDDSHEVDARADVYSLGATLYKLLCGEAPFAGPEYSTPIKKMMALANQMPAPIGERRRDLPEPLAALIQRMLSKEPTDRPASAAEVVTALAPYARDADLISLAAVAAGSEQSAVVKVGSTESNLSAALNDTTTTSPFAAARSRRTGWRWALAAAASFALIGLAILFSVRTPQGTIVVEVPNPQDPGVKLQIAKNGAEVKVLDASSGWEVEIKEGQYHLTLLGGADRLTLEDDTLKVERNQRAHVVVTLKREPQRALPPSAIAKVEPRPIPPAEPTRAPQGPQQLVATARLRGTYEGHEPWFGGTSFSQDGAALAHAGLQGKIVILDVETGEVVKELIGHKRPVHRMVFSPIDPNLMASTACNEEMRLWDLAEGREIGTLRGHVMCAPDLQFSPDGLRLVSCSRDRTVKLWDVASAQLERSMRTHDADRDSVAFSPDGTIVVSGGRNGIVSVFDAQTGDVRLEFSAMEKPLASGAKTVGTLAFSPDGTMLAANHPDRSVAIWNPYSGQRLALLRMPLAAKDEKDWQVQAVSFSPDGTMLAVGTLGVGAPLYVWDVLGRRLLATLLGHGEGIFSLAWSPDGKLLASGSKDKTLKLWEIEAAMQPIGPEGEERRFAGHTARVMSLAFSPDARTVLSAADDRTVRAWDVLAGTEIRTIESGTLNVECLAISADGRLAASGSEERPRVWELASGREPVKLGDQKFVQSAAFSADGKRLLTGGLEDVRLWDLETGALVKRFSSPLRRFTSVMFCDGEWLMAFGLDKVESPRPLGTIQVWNATTAALLAEVQLTGFVGGVQKVEISPDARLIASLDSPATIGVWEAASGKKRAQLVGHGGQIDTVTFSADGRYLASGGRDRTIRIWDVETEEQLHQFTAETDCTSRVAFSPDRRWLASAGGALRARPGADQDATVHLWRLPELPGATAHALPSAKDVLPKLATGEVLRYSMHRGDVQAISFLPDGRAASVGSDNALRVWDAATGAEQAELKGHAQAIKALAISADGKLAATGSDDSKVVLWDLGTKKEIRKLDLGAAVRRVALSPDASRVLGVGTAQVCIWNVADGKLIAEQAVQHQGTITTIAVSPDLGAVALGGEGTLLVLRVGGENPQPRKLRAGPGAWITASAFSSDGKVLVSAGHDAKITLWDLAEGEPSTLGQHQGHVLAVAFSNDGSRLVSSGVDGQIRLWDVAARKPLTSIEAREQGRTHLALSPDGRHVLSAGSRIVHVWELPTDTDAGPDPPRAD